MKKFGNNSIAVIATVFNEAESVEELLQALRMQTKTPDEVIIVDGGSTDSTYEKMKKFSHTHSDFPLKIFQKKGNRSLGRNFAITKSQAKLIAITDAGCIPEENWLEELLLAQSRTKSDVVAGYYRGQHDTPFERAVVPYALVMPDKVNPSEFLPATRSMLIKKSTFQELGGFDANLSDNEDYDFAIRLKKAGKKIVFAPQAIVAWQPRTNLRDFYKMIYRFARGDIYAGIYRPKVLLIFARYIALIGLLFFFYAESWLWPGLLILLLIYSAWSINKNFQHAQRGWYWLPILQIASDIAVMHGSVAGVILRAGKLLN